jgi:hypothetical protein
MANKLLKIFCYDTESNLVYELYEGITDASSVNSIVDAKAYAENGLDILYFTDNTNEVRQLRCEIPDPNISNFLTDYDLSLQRRGASGVITPNNVDLGGSLLSGSYQFAYRMVNPDQKRFTKWSSLTLPVNVPVNGDSISLGLLGTSYVKYAGVGLFTNKKINLTISPSQDELDNFTHFQLAVVENILPTDQLSASLLPIEPLTKLASYDYTANQRIDRVPIEDVVVDFAAIQTAKTLNVKQNRLFLGNIEYWSLDIGTPTITGEVITKTVNPVIAPNVFSTTKGFSQSINGPINGAKVNWEGALSPNNDYTHSGADQEYLFTYTIIFIYNTTAAPIRFELTKNGTEVLETISTSTAGTYTISKRVILSDSDTVDVRVWCPTIGSPGIAIQPGTTWVASTNNVGAEQPSDQGYFRDEVYRFGIVYRDTFGNKSTPVLIDLSGVVGNRIEQGLKDLKFPSREEDGGAYTILDTNDLPRLLGVRLTISNHPSWATGFEIVRVKRIKRVLFQSPMIPMMYVQGVGALLDYPGKVRFAATTTTDYNQAQPMTSTKVYVPKNLLWPELRDVIRNEGISGTNADRRIKGEARLARRAEYDMGILFPPQSMYTQTLYNFSGSEKIETVDFTLNRVNLSQFTAVPAPAAAQGNDIVTVMSATFHSLQGGDYYFNPGFTNKKIPSTERVRKVNEYKFVDNLSTGTVVGGEKVMQYSELSTQGVSWGYQPSVQRMAIVKIGETLSDEGSVYRQFASGTHNAVSGGTAIVQGDSTVFETNLTNTYINQYAGPYLPEDYVQSIRIVNVVNDTIGDSRYGEWDDTHEYISTGASYCFTPTELTAIGKSEAVAKTIDVFGGDCIVAYHVFKISDSSYSVINQEKHNGTAVPLADLFARWDGKVYGGASNEPVITLPLALKAVGQFVQVFLESEYNGQVMDYDILEPNGTQGVWPIMNVKSEANIRTPLSYRYNQNISKQNDQKIYLSKSATSFVQDKFPARIMYSDIKVYNSDISGFDLFRVLNFYDLEEDKGALTKLAVAGDSLYAIQEFGVKYLPTGQSQLEQTDAGTLAVGTSDVIGRVITVDNNRGGQHLAAIVETGGAVYIPDNFNKSVYRLTREGLAPIPVSNESLFRNIFTGNIAENGLRGFYDPIRFQYWLIGDQFAHVFHEAGIWTSNLEFGQALRFGVYANQGIYLMNQSTNSISSHKMYVGDPNNFFGGIVVPRVKIVINPDADFGKIFDNMMFVASERLLEVDMVVEREESLPDQEVFGMNLDSRGVDGNYRIKTLRDSKTSRLRGLRAIATIKWGNILSTLSSVVTKYRLTSRHPY